MIDRIGIGYDLHRLATGRRLILAHVPIRAARGPIGHSDGDVVLHALIDAMLGAAGLPDIGELFPNTDPQYKDADSGTLLSKAYDEVRHAGYRPVNIDIIVHAEQPRIAQYKLQMRQELARLLDIDVDQINIKGKTGEDISPIGTGEAIASTVVVGLARNNNS
jgi:2-C-methyl-D-erythritol 2,4-cyclodiphosphate synthase